MKLKALLLGSAAAMIAVSGARAADAVVAEPEPMDYVKVCDMYGSGFHYIPGTETCMNINGYARVDLSYNTDQALAATTDIVTVAAGGAAPANGTLVGTNAGVDIYTVLNPAYAGSTSTFQYRARINFDVRNETDWGTLRSEIRLQADGDASADGAFGADRVLISLGGLRMGYSDSYITTAHGYGLPGIEKYDGIYGYDQAMFVDYTYAANGFSATVGFQDSNGASGINTNPHIDMEYYAGIRYSGSMFTVAATYLHEENTDEGSYKLSAVVTPVEGLTIKGWYAADSGATRQVGGVGADYYWGVGANYQATDTLSVAAGYTAADAGGDYFTVGAIWNPVPGLSVRPNAQFRDGGGESYSVRVYRTF